MGMSSYVLSSEERFYENAEDVKVECDNIEEFINICLLYTSPSPRDATLSRMPSSA